MTAIKGNLQFKGTFRHLPPLYTILRVATIKFSTFHRIFFLQQQCIYLHFLNLFTFIWHFLPSPKVLRQHWPCPGSRPCSGSVREDDGLSLRLRPRLRCSGRNTPALCPSSSVIPRLSHPAVTKHISCAIIFIQTLDCDWRL